MSCDRIRPLLSSYHDDALSLGERARVRAHVTTCPACSAVLAAYERMFVALRDTAAPVPPDLRRNVYARIAEIEARRGSLPFGLTLFGALRSAGATAGLLAVLAALVAAVVHLNGPQPTTGSHLANGRPPSNATAPAGGAVMSAIVGASNPSVVSQMPATDKTAVAALKHAVAAGARVQVNRITGNASRRTVDFDIVRKQRSGAPRDVTHGSLSIALASRTPIASSLVMGTPSPVPTIPAGDGLAYIRLTTDNAFYMGRGNSQTSGLEWHSFASGGPPVVLVTPAPAAQQLLTGLNASRDGESVVYTAMSVQRNLSGVFGFTMRLPQPLQLLPAPDLYPPNHGPMHRYIQQLYPMMDGRWLLSLVDAMTASVVITSANGFQLVARINLPTSDYVVSPDGQHIAWTFLHHGRFGTLEVANLNAQPMTRTIAGIAYHPVWSPDGASMLFLRKARQADPDGSAALWIWSMRDGSLRPLVPANPSGVPFVSSFAWAPGGRYVAYVLTTGGPRGQSQVWLCDVPTGDTWPSFKRRWIGAIAWVHGQALTMSSAVPGSRPSLPSIAAGTTQAAPAAAAATSPATATPPPLATPAAYDATDSPADVLRSYYNAINRHDYKRAYGYLASSDGKSLQQFARGYADTRADAIVTLTPARYLTASSFHASTCVGLELLAHHWDGHVVRFGGWYLVESTRGQNPHFTGWRIVMKGGTRMMRGGTIAVPPQARCTVRQPAAAA